MTINRVKTTLLSSSLLLFTACGGGGDSAPSSGSNPISVEKIVPQNINIDIPDSLKSSRSSNDNSNKIGFQKVNTSSVPSYGYTQLKMTISEAEDAIFNIKENLVILNHLMPAILSECAGTALNEKCTIPAEVISLTIDSGLKSELAAVAVEFDKTPETLPNTTLVLGEVLYTHNDVSKNYQHNVVLDLQPTLSVLGQTLTKDLEGVKWSDDENSIETHSDYEDNDGHFTMHLTYHKNSDGSSLMKINDSFSNTELNGNFLLNIKDLNDINKSVEVSSSGKFGLNTFNSTGKVSKNGGYLISKGSSSIINYAEKETFDATGNVLKNKFCDGQECDLKNETTWHTFDASFEASEENGFDDSSFSEEFSASTEQIELNVTGTTLPTYTACELLAPDFSKVSTVDNIYNNSVGSIARFDDYSFGVLLNADYKNSLASLRIFCNTPDNDEFHELLGNEKPTLSLR